MPSPRTPAADQVHIDLGALAQRVTGAENAIANLSNQFTDLSKSFSEQMRDLGGKIDGQQRDAAAATVAAIVGAKPDRNATMAAIGTVAGVLVSVFVVIGSMALSPIRETLGDAKAAISDLDRNSVREERFQLLQVQQQNRNLALSADLAELRKTQEAAAERLATLEGVLAERQASYLRDAEAVFADLRTLDANLIKRPEIEAANKAEAERTDALSARLNGLQTEVSSFFPASKIIDEMWAQLRESRNNAAAVAPVAPVVPVSPAVPARPPAD